ncbi:ABC transporter ATP-binding protein [Butyrivibrio sp. YAB3001]|uniref:ABC transporter ATP-binding protein n=1 Tax=Butyrivibrio sp. YAB3001 TaxID=1520812 RepID=UPI0008F67D00|nr:ABC transporter ATP-binding protein [Butyrivibrio sp. YAB3001]SFC86758.1 ATP-binding cassette, subfamily B [Butyrivibrio sp. YAB3001]
MAEKKTPKKSVLGSLSKLLRYTSKLKAGFIVVAFLSVLSTLFSVLGPKIMGVAVNEIVSGIGKKVAGTGGIDFDAILKVLIILFVLYILSCLFIFIQSYMVTGMTQTLCFDIRRDISEKINRMPVSYFESRQVGDVLSLITNDVDILSTGLNQCVIRIITPVTTIIGIVIMMLTISPLLTGIAFLILPVSVVFIGMLMGVSQKHYKNQQDYLGLLNGQIEESFSGQQVIRLFGKEKDIISDFKEKNDILYSAGWKSQFMAATMVPIMNFVGNLGYVGVAIISCALVVSGTLTIGDVQAFIQYVKNFTQPIQQIAEVVNQLQAMAAASDRIFEFLEEEDEDIEHESPVAASDIKGSVSFEGISFGYDPAKIIINNFSSEVKPGQKIAIVGPTGAGKTTVIKLLMRFYDVNKGKILLDGFDLKEYDRRKFRQAIGMVLQETWLFNGTIMENIRYGRIDATDEEVIEAAKAARAHGFIKALPGGYNMEISEEADNLSQGQKQLITIARAILSDRKIMILDEATSSVDTRTELLIQEAMDHLMEGRTSFIIAHRLSTIRNADLILVMKDGDIIEQGNHEQLLKADGFYADLYKSQFAQAG